ncbi:MAG: glycosyltransferase family 9 protein [Desulfovibrio sp.]|nr:glycosyltransferase family 9 protein [Desulfovibrio sp.]
MALDCLVINLTRFGDLLQSQPLLHALRSLGYSTGLLCLENFAGTAKLLKHVDQVWGLPGSILLAKLDEHWQTALHHLQGFVAPVQAHNFRLIINLTATISARLLANLLKTDKTKMLGFGLDCEGFSTTHGVWTTFLSGTTAVRQNAVFNIADMFRLMGPRTKEQHFQQGLFPPDADQKQKVQKLLSLPKATNSPNGFVAFQLGASVSERAWPVENFVAVAEHLWNKEHLCPVLTGSAQEEPLAQEYAKKSNTPFISVIGKTSLLSLAALLTKMRLLLTNDTGTLHLAAGLGILSISFFLATAQPWDTGPYFEGCFCLEPDLDCHPCAFQTPCPHNHYCRNAISAQSVITLIDQISSKQTPNNIPHVRVWETTFDSSGFANLICHSNHETTARTLWIRHQRLFWCQFLNDIEQGDKRFTAELPPCPKPLQNKLVPILSQVLRLLPLLKEQTTQLHIPQMGKLLLRNCERLQNLLNSCTELTSFAHFWHELRMQDGQSLEKIAAVFGSFYNNINELLQNIQYGTVYASKKSMQPSCSK